ncbi:hypothetical protein ACOMHN_033001 [Nucella lapillus]
MTSPGYTPRSIPRLTGPGGGLAIVFKDELTDFLTITSNTTNLTFRSIEVFELRLSLFVGDSTEGGNRGVSPVNYRFVGFTSNSHLLQRLSEGASQGQQQE